MWRSIYSKGSGTQNYLQKLIIFGLKWTKTDSKIDFSSIEEKKLISKRLILESRVK